VILIPKKPSSLRTLLGLSSFQILAMFRRGMFYTFLSIYFSEFLNLSVTETTLYATLPMIMNVVFQNFIWGPLSDKIQKRKTFVILGEVLAGIGTILVWFIHSVISNLIIAGYVIIFGLMCIEAFWSMSNIGWSALISDIYPSKERTKVMGQLSSIGGFGRIIGITIGGLLYNYGFGFRDGPLFWVASMVMFVSAFPMLLTPEGGITLMKIEEDFSSEISQDQPNNHKNIFLIFILALIFINFGRNSLAVPYSQYLVLDSGFNIDSITLSYVANMRSIAVLLIGFSAGPLSKKFGHAKTLIIGALVAIISILFTALTDNLVLIFVGSFLMGTSEVIIVAAAYSIASILIPLKKRAKLFGLYNTTFFLSWGLASTIISGPLIDLLIIGGFTEVFAYQSAFIVSAFITSIGLVLFVGLEFWLVKHNNHYEKSEKI
jgi:MFS family permease